MANVPEVFNVLSDDGGAGGEPLISRTEGEVAAAKAGLIGFSYKDSSGNVVLPQLTTDGKIPVTSDSAGVHLEHSNTATATGGRDEVATLTLTADKLYKLKFLSTSSSRDVFWEVEQVDDATTTVNHRYYSGSGQYTQQVNAGCLEFQAGSTGTQTVKVYGTQITGPNSDLHATICLLQIGA